MDDEQTPRTGDADPDGRDEADTEGHGFLTDAPIARQIARDRTSDMERAARERERQKEARPNRDAGS